LSRCVPVFTEHPVLALASCIPAELVSFLKGKSKVAIIQDVCKIFILLYLMFNQKENQILDRHHGCVFYRQTSLLCHSNIIIVNWLKINQYTNCG
jgi:hypothetical protein